MDSFPMLWGLSSRKSEREWELVARTSRIDEHVVEKRLQKKLLPKILTLQHNGLVFVVYLSFLWSVIFYFRYGCEIFILFLATENSLSHCVTVCMCI